MKKLLLLFCFTSSLLNSQILDNKRGLAFTDQPFFDENFIKLNKVKKIKGEYTFKKAGDIMRKTPYKSTYEFDSSGHLIESFETRSDDGIKDTIQNMYAYSPTNLLTMHRKKDSGGYGSVHYQYDKLGHIISEETHRDVFDMNGNLERTFVINNETMKYDTFPLQQKKTVFNSHNLPYMEEFSYYNADGYLLEKEERLKMTSGKVKQVYEYNEKGFISAIRSNATLDGKFAEEWFFKYDEFGDIIEKHVYKNGVFTTDIQIIYNTDTKLLSSVLTREVKSNFIMILRFMNYEFYK